MATSAEQAQFTVMIGQLIQWAHHHGYRLTFGDAYRDPRLHGEYGRKKAYGAARSNHKLRLAVDFNLFTQDSAGRWRYRTSTKAHEPLGEFWESIGGSWGGRFNDGNHYEFKP